MAIIAATTVFKTYRLGRVEVPVLRGASISIDKGEWVSILGASGSGKSTLLHILGGLDRPDRTTLGDKCPACGSSLAGLRGDACPECGKRLQRMPGGTVLFEGQPVGDLSPRGLDRYRSGAVGFVFQFYHLLPELTVMENVTVGSMIKNGAGSIGKLGAAGRKHARELLEAFGLGHRLGHRPTELSGGERQRVAIARALINDPPLLLADEPTGNLDRKTGSAILDAISEHRRKTGRTLVIVTHDKEVAERADRIVRLEDGRIAPGQA